jgi:hypothetical protein
VGPVGDRFLSPDAHPTLMPADATKSGEPNLFLNIVEALSDRHGQVDIRLDHVALHLPVIRESVELNGTISVSVHLRELTDQEKSARASKEIRALSS